MKTKKSAHKKKTDRLERTYSKLFKSIPTTLFVIPEWRKPGDNFEMFSLYDKSTSTYSSSETVYTSSLENEPKDAKF